MRSALKLGMQLLLYGGFAAFLGWLSASPAYEYAPADQAVVKLSLSHAADRIKPCVRVDPQELAELPPNMRIPEQCERERLPLLVELDIDGAVVARIEAQPSGLWSDGPASVYERFSVPPGRHVLAARLRDSARTEGWDYAHTETVTLTAGRYLTVKFRAETGGFEFR
jgi:hypothetical protein